MVLPSVDVSSVGVIVAAIVSMVVGMLWYSPVLFGKPWMKLMGIDQRKVKAAKSKGMAKLYLIQFVGSIIMAYVLAHFVAYLNVGTMSESIIAAFWIWIGFIATTMLGMVLWEGKSWKLYFINASYFLVTLALMAITLSFW